MKHLFKALLLSTTLLFSSLVFAGQENWSAVYVVQSSGGAIKIAHDANKVSIYDMTGLHRYIIYTGIYFYKGQDWYGVIVQDDCTFSVNTSMEAFEAELKKLGNIVSKE